MKLIFIGIALFCFIPCSGGKTEDKMTVVVSTDKENKAEADNVEVMLKDTPAPVSNYNLNEQITFSKYFELFWIRDLEDYSNIKAGFISLSDIYQLSENTDSLAIPSFENEDKYSLQYIKLDSIYRKRFLSKTNISETDSVFIFNYSTDALLSFNVRKLNVVACLNIYMDINDCPCRQGDYMIGFEITKNNLGELVKYFNEALVFIGNENPFVKGQMKAIVWEKIKTEKFPLEKSNLTEMEKQDKHKNTVSGPAYLYETDKFQIFIQDYTEPNSPALVQDRHLIVIDKQTGNLVNELMFSNSESESVAPLNFGINNANYPDLKEQWTGKLFKDKPEVLFGFEWVSFGCPGIYFVNSKDKYVQINCDNRH